MSDEDLIRRGDAKRFAHQAIIQRGKHANAAASVDHALAALPAVDPLADPRVQALVEGLRGFMSKVDTACLVERDHPQAEFADAWRDAYAIIAEIEGSNAP